MLLYYITDRKLLPGGGPEQTKRVLMRIADAARAGVDYVQLREKDLSVRELERLALAAMKVVRENGRGTKLLINSRLDVALACGADGVHLTANDISVADVRAIVAAAKGKRRVVSGGEFLVAVSTHSEAEVGHAYAGGADFVVFGPVFGKVSAPAREGVGLVELRGVCERFDQRRGRGRGFGVLALGGVTRENAWQCVAMGASGVAGIRLFQEDDVIARVAALRAGASAS